MGFFASLAEYCLLWSMIVAALWCNEHFQFLFASLRIVRYASTRTLSPACDLVALYSGNDQAFAPC